MSVHTIDCEYLKPGIASAYLMVEGGEAAFVETNTAHAVPRLLQALSAQGMTPEQVRYVIVTHVHLDHAGGASALMQRCPNATLLAHPNAARHLIDPSRLVSSARKVYGDEAFRRLYGDIGPIDPGRVRIMQDGERITFGSRQLEFLHTRGHANHHFCVLDSGSEGIFTGDAFGLAYPALQKSGLFIFPSTSPTDFDPEEARRSVERIAFSGARRAYLTHFGPVDEMEEAAGQLVAHLEFSRRLLDEAAAGPQSDEALVPFCRERLERHFETLLARHGLGDEARDLLRLDLDLNAQGIAFAAKKRRASPKA